MTVSYLAVCIVLVVFLLTAPLMGQAGFSKAFPAVEQLPAVAELPDPFLFLDGRRVSSQAEWAERRRELLELIQYYQYGRVPPRPLVKAEMELPGPTPEGGWGQRCVVRVHCEEGGKSLDFPVQLTLPGGSGPYAVIIRSDLVEAKWPGAGPVAEEIVQEILRRGYALADFDRTLIAADRPGREGPIFQMYPEGDFGVLAAWAWGYQRVIDALLELGLADPQRIVVTGHSRGGKAALLAGAVDERITLTVPNGSGCGGAGCYRFLYGRAESIRDILDEKRYRYWFTPRLVEFIGQVERLPFDQHCVKALIAPRGLLSTEGLEDTWANPQGTQLTHLAAKEVFAFLGVPERIGIHYRPGRHDQNREDWLALLDFADYLFFQKPLPERFNRLPFPQERRWSWSVP